MHKKYHEKFKILDILAVTTKAHEKKHPVPVPGKNKNFLGFQNSYLKTSFSYDACFSEWPLEANCYKTADFNRIQCLSPAKKYKLYKSSINKSLHFVQRRLSSSTRG